MPNYCTQCGIQIFYEAELCNDCVSQPRTQQKPFAEQTFQPKDFSQYQTRPLNQPPVTLPIQPFNFQQNLQNTSACPYCGGSGGIMTKSTISMSGWTFMGIMFTLTFFGFVISAYTQCFPCAIIPFGLIFLGLLFKETHFVCINCGQKIN